MRPSRRPTSTSWPSTTPETPTPGRFRKDATDGSSPISARAARATACAIGCSRRRFDGAGQSENVRARGPVQRHDLGQLHAALGHGAGLVEHDRVDATRLLEDLRPLDQDAELRSASRADHQRGRRRQAEGAGARDDQHRHRGGERRRRRSAEREPAGERQEREHEHDRDEDRGDAVGESLHRSLARLGGLDETRDLRERGVGADLRRAHDHAAVRVDGCAGDFRSRPDLDGERSRRSAATGRSPTRLRRRPRRSRPSRRGERRRGRRPASSSTATSTSSPSRRTRASFAPSSSSLRIASDERPLARASR